MSFLTCCDWVSISQSSLEPKTVPFKSVRGYCVLIMTGYLLLGVLPCSYIMHRLISETLWVNLNFLLVESTVFCYFYEMVLTDESTALFSVSRQQKGRVLPGCFITLLCEELSLHWFVFIWCMTMTLDTWKQIKHN